MSGFVSFMRFWQCLVFVANCLFKSSDDISKRGHWSKKFFFFSVVGFSPDSFRVEPISQKPVRCVLILFDHKGLPDFKLHFTQTFQPASRGNMTAYRRPISSAKVADRAFGEK